jgi:hypothetical protein
MPKALMLVGASMATLGAAFAAWRRDRRIGSAFVNTVVNPLLLHRGLAGGAHSEIGPLEHVGRRSGIRRLTPVHPEATHDGFRVMLPLGEQSEWARNVLTAGHCRMRLHGQVYDLDDPKLVSPKEVSELPRLVRNVTHALGFRYLTMRTLGMEPGTL